jgi:hypothetical protein
LGFTKENAAARGSLGAARRWGSHRIARLDDLDPAERALVLALIEAGRSRAQKATTAKETAPAFEVPEAVEGGRRVSADHPVAA